MKLLSAILVMGVGATLAIDLWAVLLRKAFGVRSLDLCLLGRWVLHMRHGVFAHDGIAGAARQPHECKVGWISHYSIGLGFAALFVLLATERWLLRPSPLPALAFGAATVIVPFITMQPAFGLGVAASRAPNPTAARLKSLMTHTVFGAGLYAASQLWLLATA